MAHAGAHTDLAGEISRLKELVREWQGLFPQAATQAAHWLKVLEQVQTHLAEEVLRVAVVGAVKSGKSTLVNAVLGRDLLKRGAGILTAMITRVRPGDVERAVLTFKSLDAIGAEIQQALNLLPDTRLEHLAGFDLRRTQDRELLAQVLAGREVASLWADGSLNQNFTLLNAYLAGYDRVQEFLAAGRLELTGPELGQHQELVTKEELAVYLEDASLTVPAPDLPPWVELGDCQGSDSPLPQHLTQVLSYLLTCDLALYVISSRIGLRQADFQFLQELKRMGLGEHLLFVLNLDLTDHQNVQDCQAVTQRVGRELAQIVPRPRLAAFSALKLLLERRRAAAGLDPAEEALLQFWGQQDPAKGALSDAEWDRFQALLKDTLETLKSRREAGGSLPQVQMVARGLAEQAEVALRLLSREAGVFRELAEKLAARRQPLAAALHSLHQALEGAVQQLKGAIKARVAAFLDQQGSKDASLVSFVARFEPDWERLLAGGPTEPLRWKLYRLFQEFQQELLKLASGEFNLQVVEFVHRQEEWLREELRRTCEPLVLSLAETLALYHRETAALGLAGEPPSLHFQLPERSPRLTVPLLHLTLEPDWRWVSEVWLRTGAGFLNRTWQKLKARMGWHSITDPHKQTEEEIRRALEAIRRWVREELRVKLLDYGEGLKFRYFFPLVDELRQGLEESLDSQVKSLLTDLEGLAAALSEGEASLAGRRRLLLALAPQVRQAEARLAALAGSGGPASPAVGGQ